MMYAVALTESLKIDAGKALAEMYCLSPFVWPDADGYGLLLRVVPRSQNPADKVARIHYGRSQDGLRFVMRDEAVIAPATDREDRDGCEDPTLAIVDGTYYVYYTGWNEADKRGNLMLASGPDPEHLTKRGIALPWRPDCRNPKEATIVQAADGTWRLFFEYAADNASKIGIASAENVDGPWKIGTPLFEARSTGWDSWHLSTGPVVCTNPQSPVMFYNGATQQAAWRIGSIEFDAEFTRVVSRCDAPLIAPPRDLTPGATDIAFAASAIEESVGIRLYYSIADQDMFRATVRQQPGE